MTPLAPPSPAPPADTLDAAHRDALDFVPLPCRSRTGWTAARQRGFIAALCELGLVAAAAGAVGMSRQSAYRLRARAAALDASGNTSRGPADDQSDHPPGSFVAAWDAAIDQGQTEALSLALDRAVNGVAEPYFYGGRQRGERLCYDNGLLIAALRAADARAARMGFGPGAGPAAGPPTGLTSGPASGLGSSMAGNGSTGFRGNGV